MAGGKSTARSKKAASAKGPTKSARSAATKTAKPAPQRPRQDDGARQAGTGEAHRARAGGEGRRTEGPGAPPNGRGARRRQSRSTSCSRWR